MDVSRFEGTSDEALVSSYVGGDGRAFDAIVDRYERRVYAVALRMTGNPDDARDVTQDVFISALRSLKRFRGDSQLSTWLHRVAVNASLDLGRKRSRRKTSPLDEVHETADPSPGPDEHAEAAIRAAEVQRALAELSDEHRAVLVLHDLQQLGYPEIAEALGVPVGTIKSRIHRARAEMARKLGHLRPREPEGSEGPLTP